RHTRSKRDWSSDVCSSDLSSLIGRSPAGRAGGGEQHGQPGAADLQQGAVLEGDGGADPLPVDEGAVGGAEIGGDQGRIGLRAQRSEERRVGKGGRGWWLDA